MNNRVVITVCSLKHDKEKVEGFIASILEAKNDDSDAIVDGRDYMTIKKAIRENRAQAYATMGDPKTELTLDLLENKYEKHNALYAIRGHYFTSNNTDIKAFIDSVANKATKSVPEAIKGMPRASVAAIFFDESGKVREYAFPNKVERKDDALKYARELWSDWA